MIFPKYLSNGKTIPNEIFANPTLGTDTLINILKISKTHKFLAVKALKLGKLEKLSEIFTF